MRPNLCLALLGVLASLQLLVAAPAAGPATSLFDAIRGGDVAAVRRLVKNGADVQARDEFGNTPLMAAALNADLAVLEELLESGADVNATNQAGATALMRAAADFAKTSLLVARGADVKARSQLSNTALILAARPWGNSRTVRLLLDRGADPNATNGFGATPLMAAVAANDLESARALLDSGAQVNARPNMNGDGFIFGGGRTPLMWAAFRGSEPMLRLLLERGAKPDESTPAGGALAHAAWGGQLGAARVLLDAGAPVNQRDLVANYTPLHWAASSEHASSALVELLLARGADANAEGGQPVDNFLGATQTPLSLARKRGDTPIVQALLKAGAKDAAAPARRSKSTAASPAATAPLSTAAAIQRALPVLALTAEESVSTFRRHASRQDCISCHQQQLPLAAISLAASRHFGTDRAVVENQFNLLTRFISSTPVTTVDARFTALEVNLQSTFHPEPAIFDGYATMDFHLQRKPASAATDALVHQLITIQHPDGRWSWNLPRPPIQASDIGATALAVHALQHYGAPALRRDLEARVRRARSWLTTARAETNEERVHQLLGRAWAGEKSGVLKQLAGDLIRQQRADGGWGQLAGLDSDAYGTGQSLYALLEGGKMAARDPAVRRGVDFLLRTQFADGTWHVRTRSHPFQPPMESSFPHGRDGWISAAATSWAVMALATSLDPKRTPGSAGIFAGASKPAAGAGTDASAPKSDTPVEFTRDILPLLERSCVTCHSGERPKGGFRLTDRAALLRGGARGEPAVVPGKPDASPLIRFVQDQVEDMEMPPLAKREKFPALTKDELAKLHDWIAQGAAWPEGVALLAPGN